MVTQAEGEEVAVIGEDGERYEVRHHHAGAWVTWSWRFERSPQGRIRQLLGMSLAAAASFSSFAPGNEFLLELHMHLLYKEAIILSSR